MPIYMRLTVDGKRIEISTQRECDPEKWDAKSCRVLGLRRELTRQLNNYLDALQGRPLHLPIDYTRQTENSD